MRPPADRSRDAVTIARCRVLWCFLGGLAACTQNLQVANAGGTTSTSSSTSSSTGGTSSSRGTAGTSTSAGTSGCVPVVTSLAGNGSQAYADGQGAMAAFYWPAGITATSLGDLYVADEANNLIREVDPSGNVYTVAGDVDAGFGAGAVFSFPGAVVIDLNGNICVSDGTNRILRINPRTFEVSAFVGNGDAGFIEGRGAMAEFNGPMGLAADEQGDLYVADANNSRIRKVDPTGNVTTWAGSGKQGTADGPAGAAEFCLPNGLALDAQGNLYVSELSNRIRKVDPRGNVTTVAGDGDAGFADGQGARAQLNTPAGLAVDGHGNLYVADVGNSRIRKIDAAGNVTTFAGNGTVGYWDGPAAAAQFAYPSGVAVEGTNVFVSDQYNNRIRVIRCE